MVHNMKFMGKDFQLFYTSVLSSVFRGGGGLIMQIILLYMWISLLST